MRRPPGLRAGWGPTQPAEATTPASLPARPAQPAPARPRLAASAPAASAPAAPAVAAPRPASQAPQGGMPAFQPTRPLPDFQPTRPLTDFQPTRPFQDFQPTRPLTDFQPTRPLEGQARQPAAPVLRRPPTAVQLTPPSAEGGWKVRGMPGQHLVLMPGQMHLGQQVASLRTLLGSCVAITLWHPQKRIGGMCHFLLPQRQRRNGEPPDGRYGDEALAEMVRALTALQTEPKDYVAHLYGGADTMSGVSAARFNIGERNIAQGWSLIDRYGIQLDGVDVGEDIPRTVSLTLATGVVAMRRGTGQAPDHLRA